MSRTEQPEDAAGLQVPADPAQQHQAPAPRGRHPGVPHRHRHQPRGRPLHRPPPRPRVSAVTGQLCVSNSHAPFLDSLMTWTIGHGHTDQRVSDGRRQPRASPMLTAIMSGGVGICGRELSLS